MTTNNVSIESENWKENSINSDDETEEIKLNLSDTNNEIPLSPAERSVLFYFILINYYCVYRKIVIFDCV